MKEFAHVYVVYICYSFHCYYYYCCLYEFCVHESFYCHIQVNLTITHQVKFTPKSTKIYIGIKTTKSIFSWYYSQSWFCLDCNSLLQFLNHHKLKPTNIALMNKYLSKLFIYLRDDSIRDFSFYWVSKHLFSEIHPHTALVYSWRNLWHMKSFGLRYTCLLVIQVCS